MVTQYAHRKVWLNGRVVEPEDATVSVFTATAMRGANVYEGLRAYWNEDQGNLFVWKLGPARRAIVPEHEDHAHHAPLQRGRISPSGSRLGRRERLSRGMSIFVSSPTSATAVPATSKSTNPTR